MNFLSSRNAVWKGKVFLWRNDENSKKQSKIEESVNRGMKMIQRKGKWGFYARSLSRHLNTVTLLTQTRLQMPCYFCNQRSVILHPPSLLESHISWEKLLHGMTSVALMGNWMESLICYVSLCNFPFLCHVFLSSHTC